MLVLSRLKENPDELPQHDVHFPTNLSITVVYPTNCPETFRKAKMRFLALGGLAVVQTARFLRWKISADIAGWEESCGPQSSREVDECLKGGPLTLQPARPDRREGFIPDNANKPSRWRPKGGALRRVPRTGGGEESKKGFWVIGQSPVLNRCSRGAIVLFTKLV